MMIVDNYYYDKTFFTWIFAVDVDDDNDNQRLVSILMANYD